MAGRGLWVVTSLGTYAGRIENLHDVIDRIRFVRGDICNEELLEHVFRELQPEIVINFVAGTHVDRSINEPSLFIRTNVLGYSRFSKSLGR